MNIKFYLLFQGENILKYKTPFLFICNTEKNGKYSSEVINFNKKYVPQDVFKKYELLKSFDSSLLTKEINTLKKQFETINFNLSLEEFLGKNFSDSLYLKFKEIYQELSTINIYHRKKDHGNIINTLCHFSNEKVKLSFKLKRDKEKKLFLETFVEIQKQKYPLKNFKLHHFILEKEDIYYLLEKRDYQTLYNLQKNNSQQEDEFIKKYYIDLGKIYTVEAEQVFNHYTEEVMPEVEIFVNELAGDFLMFTPRWSYDGHLVDDVHKDSFTVIENTTEILYKRNKDIENETVKFLQNAHPNFKNKTSFYLKFSEATKKNWFFNFYYNELKENYTVTGMDMLSFFRYSDEIIDTEFRIIKIQDHEVVARLNIKFGKEKIPLKIIQKALMEDKKFILLNDQSLGIIPDEWIELYGSMMRLGMVLNNNELSFAKWVLMLSDKIEDYYQDLSLIIPKGWEEKLIQWNTKQEPLYNKPQLVNAELRPYQQKGYDWLNLMAEINAGCLLADEMGLGKTLQTITTIAHTITQNPKAKILIVAPASLIYNWKAEIEKFAPSLSIHIYHGASRDYNLFVKNDTPILITSYSMMRNDQDILALNLWDVIVLDESHHIKNPASKQTKAALALKGKKRILLNGTPIMNNLMDLYPQFNFILPQLFHSESKFKNDYTGKKLSEQKISELKKITNLFILRRTKEIAAPDLPPKVESVLWCEMENRQREIYDTVKKQIKSTLFNEVREKGLNKAKLGVLQGIIKLRQICSSPKLIKGFDELTPQLASSIKIDTLTEEITTNLKEHKVVVFSQFIDTLAEIKQNFDKHNISYCYFDGSTKSSERIQLVEQFQNENSNIQVFLLSLMAGNSGINLTQANYAFLVEPWWNKAVQQQAIDRIHRIGQDKHVFAYNMICKDSIEEKIIQLQNKKKELSEAVIVDDENFVKNLTTEDLEFLFE